MKITLTITQSLFDIRYEIRKETRKMNGKDRVKTALKHQEPDRVPISCQYTRNPTAS